MAFLLSAAVGFFVSMGLRPYQSLRRQPPGFQPTSDQPHRQPANRAELAMIALAELTIIALGFAIGV